MDSASAADNVAAMGKPTRIILAVLLLLWADVASAADKQQTSPAVLLPQMLAVPTGCFIMGSPEYETGRGVDETPHRVCVKGFKIAKHELTVAEFSRFVAATQYQTDAERNTVEPGCWSYRDKAKKHWQWWSWANWRTPVQDEPVLLAMPVTCVSWWDAMAYINWLNQMTGQAYRLPTEAEWEYAARAGTTTARYWGNNPDLACRYANVADQASQWPEAHACADGFKFIASIGRLQANKFGLYDMLGNVWEWTCSQYVESYGGAESACSQEQGAEVMLAIRGGGWNADAVRVRAAYRNWGVAWSRQANQGFRLVRER